MIEDFLARVFVNQWIVFLVVSFILLGLGEIGWRLGHSLLRRRPKAAEAHSGSVQGAVLGLLGLLLGFSFAMAVGRYDNRRHLVVEEANSIGTTFLRADFLPEPHASKVRELLRKYAKARLEVFEPGPDAVPLKAHLDQAAAFHKALWQEADAAARVAPSPITASFITSLNETIDLHGDRLAARRNHVPGAVWILLLAVAGCGAWASGYGSGTTGMRSAFSQIVFPLLVAVVITLIADIDQPSRGFVGVSQEPLKELLESMRP